jgi:hypothetical protein
MFESNMLENMAVVNNPWRNLVTPQFKAFLDSLSTSSKEDSETTENEED